MKPVSDSIRECIRLDASRLLNEELEGFFRFIMADNICDVIVIPRIFLLIKDEVIK